MNLRIFVVSFLLFPFAAYAHTGADSLEWYMAKGQSSYAEYDYIAAVGYFEKAQTLGKSANGNNKAELDRWLGFAYRRVGRYAAAQKKIWSAVLYSKKHSGEKSEAYLDCSTELALLFVDMGKQVLAEKILQQNLELIKKKHGKRSVQAASVMSNLGRICTFKSDFETAEGYHARAREIYASEQQTTTEHYAHNLAGEAFLYLRKGYFTASEALLRQADFLYQKLIPAYAPARLEVLELRAALLVELRNYNGAAELLSTLQKYLIKTAGAQHPEIARAKTQLAGIYMLNGYYAHARHQLSVATPLLEKSFGPKHLKVLTARAYAGVLAMHTGEYRIADSLLENAGEAIAELMGENSYEYSEILLYKADLYYRMGRYADAVAMHEHSLVIKKELLDITHPHYMKSYKDLGLLRWAQQKQSIADRNFKKSCNNYLNQFERYFVFLSEKEKGYFYTDIRTHFDKFNAFVLAHYSKDPGLLADMYDFHLATKGLLFHSSHEVRARIAASNDPVLFAKYKRWISVKEHLAKLYKLDRSEIEAQAIPLDSLEEMANFLEKELSLRVELGYSENSQLTSLLEWQQIKNALSPGEAALEIIRVQDFSPDSGGRFLDKVYYVALLITAGTDKQPHIIINPNGSEMENRYIKFYKNAVKMKIADKVSYQNFWGYIAEAPAMKGVKKLYLSADGVYNQLNINTFYNESAGTYVIDELDIHFLSNTKDLLKIKSLQDTVVAYMSNPVFLGYPKYYAAGTGHEHQHDEAHHLRTRGGVNELFRGGVITDLPGTKKEIQSISKVLSQAQRVHSVHLETEANENLVKSMQSPTILHIATHGFFMEDKSPATSVEELSDSGAVTFEDHNDNPLVRSGIMLMGAGEAYSDETLLSEIKAVLNGKAHEDGILTAYEALNLNLDNTELVVLSACETGLGVVKNGEGVYGLQRSLQTAGAKAVIMSLWKVNDEATQLLMTEFYTQWLSTGDKRTAFRTAQSKLRQVYPEPMYWGAFVMIGE